MESKFVYSPHYEFFIDKAHRDAGYNMRTFHVHKKYEIYYQIDGTRQYYINEDTYLVNAGSIVLIGTDEVHKTSSVDNNSHARYVLNFNREYLDALSGVFPDIDLFECFEMGLHVFPIQLRQQALIETYFERMIAAASSDTPEHAAEKKLTLALLLIALNKSARSAKEKATAPSRVSNKTIDKIQSYISTHYKDDLSLSLIASQFYISPYYLSHLFKKMTNLSIVEYINSVRLMAAKNLLETTDMKVTAVAEDTGFSTTAHFSRVFKDGTGFSPQQYRKTFQRK